METTAVCAQCGARWEDSVTCQDHFYQMLYWENENPPNGVVHHLTVLCYYLQHPALYSKEGLTYSLGLLEDFLERGMSPEEARKRSQQGMDSEQRQWKVTARPESIGAYAHPVSWTMRAQDITARGEENYIQQVRAWARSIYDALQISGNLPAGAGKGS